MMVKRFSGSETWTTLPTTSYCVTVRALRYATPVNGFVPEPESRVIAVARLRAS
jgi:hypothetical protein